MGKTIVKNVFKYQHVIRAGSWKRILISQIKKTTLVSALISVIYIMFVVLYCKWNGIVLYNWDTSDSLFYIYMQKQLEISGIIVYMYAFICIFLRCVAINHIMLLFLWGCDHEIMGVLTIFCLTFAEAVRGGRWICRLFVFNYSIWCEKEGRLHLIVQSAVYVIAAVTLYRYLLLRKEQVSCE